MTQKEIKKCYKIENFICKIKTKEGYKVKKFIKKTPLR